jgi:rfaE bifunctional protein nucleotidyltransferase chain/domain
MQADQTIGNKIVNLEDLAPLVKKWKADQKKIVFTNGCFDLLHAGHIAYLSEAAALGNKLVIGLNNDSSVKNIKGSERPINDEKTRSLLLAAMYFIDAVVLFNEDTPLEVIKVILPDVLVKGGDYAIENIVGAKETIANGGSVEVLSFLPGYSSTSIIDKIKRLSKDC